MKKQRNKLIKLNSIKKFTIKNKYFIFIEIFFVKEISLLSFYIIIHKVIANIIVKCHNCI
jgi:hypothetical protein